MDIETAVNNICKNYSCYGIKRQAMENVMKLETEKRKYSVTKAYNLIRCILGKKYNRREYFTLGELSEMYDQSEEESKRQYKRLIARIEADNKAISDYFPKDATEPLYFFPLDNDFEERRNICVKIK